ncbi:hypothetical protein C343_03299 [Cryptococcus neoformans C23]|uniref:RNA helicase n=1 Tax=Cryptococcus neoformans (strain H99 / ATCC 208821 / CBS 10515 / FGSC 9487) TaxID=235443 RepID=J9VL47_CRYN9|nr:hypothetical protein CNAG_00922 [Cryptococcus neoformans var. grubii H99]AUB24974.1 hypothetical protein CKF44_00922 [Cryptococcus neoformans var. grubii]OWZ31802.1 hypothetical protein C347_03362 [Cryptococcus neoformans var. grubii AD2-60a]OWZ43877.1 hypothetical protein C343_03299 [Cryptococcus neoformans var. grubii C23]OXC84610.1 hypothetical protein C344_03061 [Cryptococcus neoformans var. grubii AD1-7a]OXG42017.1 hypothetical protein C359_02600 [Cryptococcus neoformans var. grubii Bt|eukprot:XP_012049195.1 hypothetical protein CNAG_00922 [Cryptococcus neoformans var. grubii H99]
MLGRTSNTLRAAPRCAPQIGRTVTPALAVSRLLVFNLSTSRKIDHAHSAQIVPSLRNYTTEASIVNTTIEPKVAQEEASQGEKLPENVLTPQLSSWTGLGVSLPILKQLAKGFPHVQEPTPAQRLFLLAVFSGNEVYLRDAMGRGKTLALAIAALELALRPSPQGIRKGNSPKVMILVPTPHLAHQIFSHLQTLSPYSSSSSSPPLFSLLSPKTLLAKGEKSPAWALPDTPIVISTAKIAVQFNLDTPQLTHIFLDEPDTMVGSLPSRHATSRDLYRHPLIRHPPPIVHAITQLLGIKITRDGTLDFAKRRNGINTVWTSATMGREFKRFVKTRGWVRRGNRVVDLDFSPSASDNKRLIRERLLQAIGVSPNDGPQLGKSAKGKRGRKGQEQKEPEHHVILVDHETGDFAPLTPTSDLTGFTPQPKYQPASSSSSSQRYILETLALLHATSPPPPGKYSLALPPEGTSLDQLGEALASLGVSTSLLTPEVLRVGIPPVAEGVAPPILLAARSSVPGLHLPQLQTVYMLGGLDIQGLSQAQRKNKGVGDRMRFYDTVTGRLGRLGTDAVVDASIEEGETQKVVSLVLAGSEEHDKLAKMFFGDVKGNKEDEEIEVVKRKKLSEWDMESLNQILEHELQDGSSSTN